MGAEPDSQEFRRQRQQRRKRAFLWDRESKLDLKEVGLELMPTIKCRTKLFLGQRPSDITSPEASQNTQFCITDMIRQSENLSKDSPFPDACTGARMR